MLLMAAGLGGILMWGVGFAEEFTIDRFGVPKHEALLAAVAAVYEELARFFLVLFLAVGIRRHFNDPMDGIIYGSIAGLGMAVCESIDYLRWSGAAPVYLPASEIVRLSGHLILGGITGFPCGMIRMRMPRWPVVLAACLFSSMAIHFLWDLLALLSAARSEYQWFFMTAAALLMLSGMAVYGALVLLGAGWSRQEFQPHSLKTLLSWPFTLLRPKR